MPTIAAFYRFAPIADPQAARDGLAPRLAALGLTGTVILATEGVNGTLAGPEAALEEALGAISAVAGALRVNRSAAGVEPFARLKVQVRDEIVTMGDAAGSAAGGAGADPLQRVGRHVAPAEWNALIAAPDVVVIDTRNAYEVAIGTFAGAIDPGIATFRDFPAWWRQNAARLAGRRIAMFCTGGIRCEKATSLALAEGAAEVFHLEGGILRYLAEVAPEESLWRGECFVFDERVAVGPGGVPGRARPCPRCGQPVAAESPCACGGAG